MWKGLSLSWCRRRIAPTRTLLYVRATKLLATYTDVLAELKLLRESFDRLTVGWDGVKRP